MHEAEKNEDAFRSIAMLCYYRSDRTPSISVIQEDNKEDNRVKDEGI
jgi:hypothetical protein